jgi:hypothetical protein
MRYYIYIGDMKNVSPCEWNNDGMDDVCNHGGCPGFVDGYCCFADDDLVINKDMFIEVTREQRENTNAGLLEM